MSFGWRLFVAFSVVVVLGVCSSVNAAGAVLVPNDEPAPAYVHVRIAVATSSVERSTRWLEITVPPRERAMWLVPVRPGATVEGAASAWLDALDTATTPHVLPPSRTPPCDLPRDLDRTDSWTEIARREGGVSPASELHALDTAGDVVTHAFEHGYRLTSDLEARIGDLYQRGWQLLAIELGASSTSSTSGTLRVTDDGGAVLPLAITGESPVQVTAFTIGPGVASLPGAVMIDPADLSWGSAGSDYEARRRELTQGGAWLREVSSHDVLFEGTRSPGVAIPSVVDAYFTDSSCSGRAWAAGRITEIVDPSELSCAGKPDLALALSDLAPGSAVLTRWSAAIAEGSFSSNVAFEFSSSDAERSPLFRAAGYDACDVAPAPPPVRAPEVAMSEGCGGSVIVPSSGDEVDEDTSSDGCSSDTSSGWDVDDECVGEDCASASSDGCSGSSDGGGSEDGDDGWDTDDGDDGWDTEDGDDGWDTEDGMTPSSKTVRTKSKKPHATNTKTSKSRSRSPLSRVALFGAAILLPLRRRRLFAKG